MSRLLFLASLRFYLRHPWQLGIAIVGIGLGVGVSVGVGLANDSAARAFELSAALIRGQATHRLLPIGGDLDERIYRDLVIDRDLPEAAPVLEAEVVIAARPDVRVPLLGIDPIQERGMRGFSSFSPGAGGKLGALIAEPGTVLLPEDLAAELGLAAGSELRLRAAGRETSVRVLGTLASTGSGPQAEPPVLADIATAQEVLHRVGRITRVDLRLTKTEAVELAAAAPPGTILVPVERQQRAFEELAAAFRTNLTALGLLALVVGTFLIYGTMSFAVLQRRATLGVLRAIGVSSRELVTSVLIEGLGVAVVATAFGLLLGHWLALGLVGLVLRTIDDLYFNTAVKAVAPSAWIYFQGAALGLAGTLLAAAKPALDAARSNLAAVLRRAALERRAQRAAGRAAIAAVAVLGAAASLLLISPRSLYAGLGGLFGVLAAGALLTPGATTMLMRGIDWALGRRLGLPAVLAIRGVSASLSRTGVAVAALTIAVATVNGVGLMISSFRTSLGDWLDSTLTADLYASFEAATSASGDLLEQLRAIEGVAGVSVARMAVLATTDGEIAVRAFQPASRGWGLSVVQGDPAQAVAAMVGGRGVLASERLMFSRGLRVGEEIVLPSPSGPQRLPIVGAYRDFNTGYYSIAMPLERYQRDWHDTGITALGLDFARGADGPTIEAKVRAILGSNSGARIRSSAGIEQLSLAVFDRTFSITEVLRVLGGIVAFLGVLSALLAIELERAHELGVLRALGFAPRQLAGTLLTQTGLLGMAAGLMAMPLGATLAALLVYVINRRSFGWSMEFTLTPGPLAGGLLLATTAALLAGIYPSWRASRVALGVALREE